MRSMPPALAVLAIALAGCSNTDATSGTTETTSAPSVTQAPTTSRTPVAHTGFTPSGDFATDVTAVGIRPDSMVRYEKHVTEAMCESDLEPHVAGGSELDMNVRMMGDTAPESGQHPDVLRAAVTYNCPNRADILEDAIQTAEEGGFIE